MINEQHAEAMRIEALERNESSQSIESGGAAEAVAEKEPEPVHSAFYNRLKTLNDKIHVFKN